MPTRSAEESQQKFETLLRRGGRQGRQDRLDRLGRANERTTYANGPNAEGSTTGCEYPATITYGIDVVDAHVRYYLSNAGCREALARPPEMVVEQGCKI